MHVCTCAFCSVLLAVFAFFSNVFNIWVSVTGFMNKEAAIPYQQQILCSRDGGNMIASFLDSC